MIDLDKAKEEFINYTNNFDIKNSNIARKIGHSLRVMNISDKIATNMGLSDEQIKLATLIGLLHDIARFPQHQRFKTFNDADSIDHGSFGVQILKENNFIRNFIESSKYDEIIFKAIENHNKYSITDGLSEEELLFVKIIRDSDKLDILYETKEIFYQGEEEEISNSILDENIEIQMQNKQQILRKSVGNSNGINEVISTISFIYDLNFKESFKIIKDNNYIDDILNRFSITDKHTKEFIEEMSISINNYIAECLEKKIYTKRLIY